MIDENKLHDILQEKEKKYRKTAERLEGFADGKYYSGYADGVRRAMNEIVGLLDEERMK